MHVTDTENKTIRQTVMQDIMVSSKEVFKHIVINTCVFFLQTDLELHLNIVFKL